MDKKTALTIKRYTPEFRSIWDALIDKSVNGSFLLKRCFMDYHQDRFEDFSYLIWRNEDLIAVFVSGLPRQRSDDNIIVAHPGLTYGGLISIENFKYSLLEEVYKSLFEVLKSAAFTQLVIKLVPRAFCRQPSEANLFFFHKNNFKLANRELNSVIDLTQPLRISKGRKDNIRKARNSGIIVEATNDYDSFWQILTINLQQTHGVRPIHTIDEIKGLQLDNPENIKLYVARVQGVVVAGVVIFSDQKQEYLHTQYISASENGKLLGAVDAILLHILQDAKDKYHRFSFGISTVKGEINYGLLSHKEGFGAEVEVLDVYQKVL